MKLVFDIETNAIDFGQWNVGDRSSLVTIHCIVIQEVESGKVAKYTGDEIGFGVAQLARADQVIGHNVSGFDIPAIQHLFPDFKVKDVYDTKDVAKSLFPQHQSHSLKPWGERLGVAKGSFGSTTDWSTFTPEMLSYCEQDVVVTSALYLHLCQVSERNAS